MAGGSTILRLARLALALPFAALLFATPALAAGTPSLGSAGNFAVLAGTAVTCTGSSVNGNVGVYPGTAITQTSCPIIGAVHAGGAVAKKAQVDFASAYSAFTGLVCTGTQNGTLAGSTLTPGIHCTDSVAKAGVLTLDAQGNPDAVFILKVAPGALTATDFSMVLAHGASACNVYWVVPAATTLTRATFAGTILSGAAITIKGGTFHGRALTTSAITLTGSAFTGCVAGSADNNDNNDNDNHQDNDNHNNNDDNHHNDNDNHNDNHDNNNDNHHDRSKE